MKLAITVITTWLPVGFLSHQRRVPRNWLVTTSLVSVWDNDTDSRIEEDRVQTLEAKLAEVLGVVRYMDIYDLLNF